MTAMNAFTSDHENVRKTALFVGLAEVLTIRPNLMAYLETRFYKHFQHSIGERYMTDNKQRIYVILSHRRRSQSASFSISEGLRLSRNPNAWAQVE